MNNIMSKFYLWQILILAGSTVSTGNRQSDVPFSSCHAGANVYSTAHATSQSDEASVGSCDKFARCNSTRAPYAIGSAVSSSHHTRLATGQVALDTSAQESERQAARQLVSQAVALSKFKS